MYLELYFYWIKEPLAENWKFNVEICVMFHQGCHDAGKVAGLLPKHRENFEFLKKSGIRLLKQIFSWGRYPTS